MCYRKGRTTMDNATLPLSKALLKTMDNNRKKLEHTSAYWQYVGTEEGVFVTYPEKRDTNCVSYENRFR